MLGEENTKFFQSIATKRYKINTVSQVMDQNGQIVYLHDQKASLFYQSFESSMGISCSPRMDFDLNDLFLPRADLEYLTDMFSTQEIDSLITLIPADKVPGPDGFNGFFMTKCWHIIAHFHAEATDLQVLNNSYITLVPKKPSPETVNDFRPISLMGFSLKFLTKLMADRLQGVILEVVGENQYEFIKGRTIQECLAQAFEYIHQCQQSKREIIILKLDFEKAFDTIEHTAILSVMHNMGFPQKWLNWVQMAFSSASSTILLNGVSGISFNCKRGVRQGDPLSPLLFVLGAELLQRIVNRAFNLGKLPFTYLGLPRVLQDQK